MRMPLLSEGEVEAHLARLPQWKRSSGVMARTYQFRSFALAMKFVSQVADAAERMDHHPDIDIRYGKVTLALTTHDSHGLTRNDIDLAAACDGFADGGKP